MLFGLLSRGPVLPVSGVWKNLLEIAAQALIVHIHPSHVLKGRFNLLIAPVNDAQGALRQLQPFVNVLGVGDPHRGRPLPQGQCQCVVAHHPYGGEFYLHRAVAVMAVAQKQVFIGDIGVGHFNGIRQFGQNPNALPWPRAPAVW